MVDKNAPIPDERASTESDRLERDPAGHVREPGVDDSADAPGVLFFDLRGRVVAATPNAEGYLVELGEREGQWREGIALPLPVQVVLGALDRMPERATEGERRPIPRLRTRAQSGSWLILHAALTEPTADRPAERVVVIVRERPEDAAWLALATYELSWMKDEVERHLYRGLSTMQTASRNIVRWPAAAFHRK